MGWIAAGEYEITARDGAVVCRNKAGRELKAVPPAVKKTPEAQQLRDTLEWLARHDAQCRAAVDGWMVRSLPVPAAVLVEVWADEAWRAALRDLVAAAGDVLAGVSADQLGLLRDVGPEGVRLVTLDGETLTVPAPVLTFPHPVLLDDLADWREFAVDLGVEQHVDQLFRQTHPVPGPLAEGAASYAGYAGGRFPELRFLLARATNLGYQVRGGYAVARVLEAGRPLEARYWLGADDPWSEAETGELMFADAEGRAVPLAQVGPVAWSEGRRMAEAIHAGRTIETEETAR